MAQAVSRMRPYHEAFVSQQFRWPRAATTEGPVATDAGREPPREAVRRLQGTNASAKQLHMLCGRLGCRNLGCGFVRAQHHLAHLQSARGHSNTYSGRNCIQLGVLSNGAHLRHKCNHIALLMCEPALQLAVPEVWQQTHCTPRLFEACLHLPGPI